VYETVYDIVAQGMRYFFILLILYILIRLVLHSVSEFKTMQEVKQQVRSVSPGYLEVLSPEELAGNKYVLLRENSVGRSRRADVSLQHSSVAPVHALIYEKKKGLYVSSYGGGNSVLLNGEPIIKHREELLYTQDTLQMGEVLFVLHLEGEETCEDA